jgi:hypothetical protein
MFEQWFEGDGWQARYLGELGSKQREQQCRGQCGWGQWVKVTVLVDDVRGRGGGRKSLMASWVMWIFFMLLAKLNVI